MAEVPQAPRARTGFKVAIICASSLEAENVQSVFDVCWEDEGKQYGKAVGDQNTYTTGTIGKHNVVLVHLSSMGSNSAALSAAGLRSSFPNIQLALVVGTCGAVPVHAKTKEEIILGDIVISTAINQYDFGRQYPTGFQRKKEIEDTLGRASPEIRAFLNMLQTRQARGRLTKNLGLLVHSDSFQNNVPAAKYPGASQDWLYDAAYLHQHRPVVNGDKCHNNLESCSRDCAELKCEVKKLIPRKRHAVLGVNEGSTSRMTPSVHFGRFGSANTVMKSGLDRDRLAAADNIVAFEMEGAGVWEQHPTVVIKAARDYADSHTNKIWQDYAAAMAAACLKVFLKEWVVADQVTDEVDLPIPIWHVPFDQTPGPVGHADELVRVKQKLLDNHSHGVVSILGLGGMGRSRMVLELTHRIKSEHFQHSISWVRTAEQSTFEKDILEIGKKFNIPGVQDEKADIKDLVKQWLGDPSKGKWVMILDNVDDETLWGRQTDSQKPELSLVNYLSSIKNGTIIVTTRARGVATFLSGKEVVRLEETPEDQAVEMLISGLEDASL